MHPWKTYIDQLDPAKQKVVLEFLNTAKKFIPDAEEAMSYALPTLKTHGKSVVSAAPWKKHLGVYPHGSAPIAALADKLPHAVASKGTLQFKYDKLPTEAEIKLIVEARLNLL